MLMLVVLKSYGLTIEEMESNFTSIEASLKDDRVEVTFEFKNGVECDSIAVYRDYNPMVVPFDRYNFPIRKEVIPRAVPYVDTKLAQNITYYYKAVGYKDGEAWAVSDNSDVTIAKDSINTTGVNYKDVHIEIDKKNYLLHLKKDKETLITYPFALGKSPFTRKIIRDRLSSPEGIYKIIYIQKNATYYKALDVDYPNTLDRVRFEVSKELGIIPKDSAIGGEIQIHGMGINSNWTAGCFALRNQDIDELLDSDLIRRGIKLIITGYEILPEDISFIDRFWSKGEIKIIQRKLNTLGFKISVDGVLGPNSRKVIGRFQYDNGLNVTCVLDKQTCKKIGYIPFNLKP